MNRPTHKTEGVNRTKTVRVYPFVFTVEVPCKEVRTPLNSITFSEQRNEETGYGYCDDYQPHAVKRMFDYKNEMLYDMRWDEAGNLNQISYVDRFGLFNSTRHLAWTEDSRLYTVADERYYSYYAYDHTGQRTLKMTGDASTVDVNAWEQHTYGCLDHVTLYPSPYMVLTNKGYTKHYYAGTERVAARIGSGGLSYDATCVTGNGEVAKRSDELFWNGVKLLNEHKAKPEDFKEMSLVDAKGKEVDWHKKIDLDKLAMSWQLEAKLDPGKIHSVIADNAYPAMSGNTRYENEPDVYFYHSDHLGGASWITDVNGKPVQHLQYLPFGEPYINQHPFGYSERFTFTGKERDEETGYGYFGARYMDYSMMTMWLSVDPMAGKYPSISPYAYCAWNPIKFVDPNGMIIDSASLTDNIKATIKSNPTFATACDALAKDPETTYSFNKWDKPKIENDRQINGEVTFDGEKVFINYIETTDNYALFEEVGHAQQVISGDIGFAYVKIDDIPQWGTIGLDCQDEINAKQWAATAAGRTKTTFSIDDLKNDGYNVDKLGATSRTAYEDYKAYLSREGFKEASFNDNGMIKHSYFHFKKIEK